MEREDASEKRRDQNWRPGWEQKQDEHEHVLFVLDARWKRWRPAASER